MDSIDQKNYGVAVRQNALYAQKNMVILNHYLENIKDGKLDNFQNFLQLARQIETHFENIKIYVEKEERRQLHSLDVWLHHFFNTRILDKLSKQERRKTVLLFREAVSDVLKDLRKEVINETRVVHHAPPRISFLKRLQSTRSLDAQIRTDEKQFDKLLHKSHQHSHHLMEHAKLISLGSKDQRLHSVFRKEVEQLCLQLKKEFHLLSEELINVEIQEAKIIRDLDVAIKKNPKHADDFEQIRNRLIRLVKADIPRARSILSQGKHIHQYLRHAA